MLHTLQYTEILLPNSPAHFYLLLSIDFHLIHTNFFLGPERSLLLVQILLSFVLYLYVYSVPHLGSGIVLLHSNSSYCYCCCWFFASFGCYFSLIFVIFKILYPILTAINDKRYDAAIKPSRLHITVAIKTMILSTTSIFIRLECCACFF